MKNKLKLYLLVVPYIGILSFFTFNIIAISGFPGYDKCSFFESKDCKSDRYSFSLNFFSELGSAYTNTDDDGSPIYEGGKNNVKNTFSMLFFNSSLVVVGIVIILFYQYFYKFFIFKDDTPNSLKYSKFCRYIGIITGIMFSGIGFVPHDLDFTMHVFFANGAFLTLLILSIFHTLSFYNSNFIKSHYSYGYILFCIFLASYLYLIFLGPTIGPGKDFSQSDLILQVVGQKLIIFTFTIAMIYQTEGIRRSLN
tara:strand:+ start:58 stop:816 length:759 start_codon:yes stop_codon:yes gene_type:complete